MSPVVGGNPVRKGGSMDSPAGAKGNGRQVVDLSSPEANWAVVVESGHAAGMVVSDL